MKKAKKSKNSGLLFGLNELFKQKNDKKEQKSEKKEKDIKTDILLQGIDTFYIGFFVEVDTDIIEALDKHKKDARKKGNNKNVGKLGNYQYSILPNGAPRYSYILENNFMQLKINQIPVGQTYPNIMVEFRAEYLWNNGIEECYKEVTALIDTYFGDILDEKISRVDMCVDLLGIHDFFQDYDGLKEKVVSKARKRQIVETNKEINALAVGSRKSKIYCRIYDKSLEIKQKKDKYWFYDLWELSDGLIKITQLLKCFFDNIQNLYRPFGRTIFDLMEKAQIENVWRIEFELKREVMKDFRIESFQDLKAYAGDVWGYLTDDWLSVRKEDNENISRRTKFDFWKKVHRMKDLDNPGRKVCQMLAGFQKAKGKFNSLAMPLINFLQARKLNNSRLLKMNFFGLEQGIKRDRTIKAKVNQLMKNAAGYLSSVATALKVDNMRDALRYYIGWIRDNIGEKDFKDKIEEKVPKYQNIKPSAENSFERLKAAAI